MQKNFIQKGKRIKISIATDPININIFGKIDVVDDTIIEVVIDGTYIQNTLRNAKCIIPGDVKTGQFETTILGAKNNRLFLTLPDEESIEILQRRKHIRSPVDFSVNSFLVGFEDKKLDEDVHYPSRLMDISVGGVRLKSQTSIPIGSVLVFEMVLEEEPILFSAKVTRCIESLDRRDYELGCQFVGLNHSDEQKLSTYCLKLQAQNRKNKKVQKG